MNTEKLIPPKTWNNLDTHYKKVLDSNWYQIISKLQSEFVKATIDFYNKKDLDFVLLPITTGSISSPMGLGSDSSPVKINIGGIDTYLADSMQFFLEYACRINKKGSYYIAPSFRGENADQRHLCQFYHSEAEIMGELDDVILLVEQYLQHLTKYYLDNSKANIQSIAGDTRHLESFLKLKTLPRCTFDEAVEILGNSPKYITNHDDLYRTINSAGENKLIEHFKGFVWLTHFDYLAVPFYQKSTKDFSKAINADLLMGIGETVGAGERHSSGEEVVEALKKHKTSEEEYKWYIDIKEQLPLQTSGFGLGVERFLLWLTKHDDIRDMQVVPRFNGQNSIL